MEYKLTPKSTEANALDNESPPYYTGTQQSGVFCEGAGNILRQNKLRQIWRNQFLGEALLIASNNEFRHFTSITLYPSENKHFTDTIETYKHYLLPDYKNRVVGITFEDLFDTLSEYADSNEYADWVNWLKYRFIVPQ